MIDKPSSADIQALPYWRDQRAIHGVADTVGVLVTGNHFVFQGMVEESCGEQLPLFHRKAMMQKKIRFGSTNRVRPIEQVVSNLSFWNEGMFGVWQIHGAVPSTMAISSGVRP